MQNKNILLINKPSGPTSHDIVDRVRKITGEKRVGHAGTLDPFAEGLLIVLAGREATKRQSEFMKLDKEYVATLRLGRESDTGDLTGKFQMSNVPCLPAGKIQMSKIKEILKLFIGEIDQVPPEYSAIKIKGKKAYELARKGEKVDLKPRKIKIYDIKILEYQWPLLKLKINCSSGTYIRSLARDIGRKLKCAAGRSLVPCGAYLEKLVRTKIGRYSLGSALSLEDIAKIHKR